jgi:hypothetical protein
MGGKYDLRKKVCARLWYFLTSVGQQTFHLLSKALLVVRDESIHRFSVVAWQYASLASSNH